jgi:Phosphoenolpyruvate carboxylase
VAIPALRLDQYDPRGLNEQHAQVAIAAFRYLAEDAAVAGRDLLGDEPQPGGRSRGRCRLQPPSRWRQSAQSRARSSSVHSRHPDVQEPPSRSIDARSAHQAGASHRPGPPIYARLAATVLRFGQAEASRHAVAVRSLRRAANTFGFYLAGVDLRQNSEVHERTVGELFETTCTASNMPASPKLPASPCCARSLRPRDCFRRLSYAIPGRRPRS